MSDHSTSARAHPLRAFLTVWFGQTVSTLGSSLSGFSLAVWIFQQTRSTGKFSLIALSAVTPGILVAPVLGVVADRFSRRTLMLISNALSAFCTALLAVLYVWGHLHLWNICVLAACMSLSGSLFSPCYSATVALLVPKESLGRASGMLQFSGASAEIVAPLAAGILISTIHLSGILLLDFVSYLIALVTLSLVRLPERPFAGSTPLQNSFISDVSVGIRYLTARRGLLLLIGYFTVTNFLLGMEGVIMPPMVMSFASVKAYGAIATAGGVGVLVGSLLLSSWGGPARRMHGVYAYGFALTAALALEALRPNPWLVGAGVFIGALATPIANGCSVPILQSKTDPAFQGRVYTTMRFLVGCGVPVAYLSAGFMADKVFGPLMTGNSVVRATFGGIVGLGPGRGAALLLLSLAVIVLAFNLKAMTFQPLREVESEIPDAIYFAEVDPVSPICSTLEEG